MVGQRRPHDRDEGKAHANRRDELSPSPSIECLIYCVKVIHGRSEFSDLEKFDLLMFEQVINFRNMIGS